MIMLLARTASWHLTVGRRQTIPGEHLRLKGYEAFIMLTRHRDEHYSRAPNCAFFSLISSKPAPKRAGRSKAARSSKASRLSLQSVAAAVSDMPSVADMTADIDDSVVTTASKASKKTTKGKKTATSRAKKTRAKKEEAVDILEDEPAQEEMPPPPPPKPSQSNKRSSDEVEDSVATNAEAPAPKKRATKTRKAHDSSATEVSQADTEMTDAPEPAEKPATKTTRKASGTRKASARSTRQASVATTASTVSPPPQIPDDNEIDRQLQADLDRPLTDDEDGPNDADPQTKKAAAARKRQSAEMGGSKDDLLTHTSTTDFAMFDPAPAHLSDAQIEADLRSMKDEMEVGQEERQPAPDELKIPKKGRKAGTRKASKQTTTKRAKEVAAPVEQPQPRVAEGAEEPDELADAEVSIVSSSTAVRRSVGRASLGSAVGPSTSKPHAKRGRPPKKKVSQGPADEPAEVAAPPEPVVEPEAKQADNNPTPVPTEEPKKRISTGKRGRPSNKSKTSGISLEEPTIVAPPAEPEPEPVGMIVAPPIEPEPEPVGTQVETEEAPVQENFSAASGSPRISRKPVPAPKDSPFAIQRKPIGAAPVVAVPPKTPGHHASPVQPAKQATVSPSPSPQASDAENRPPSSKPDSNNSKGKRMPLGELPVTTPARQVSMSPSKQQRNVIGGLQSTENWTAVDLDLIFEDQTNSSVGGATDRFLAEGGELTDEERNMTVEEWIYHNAGQAEQKLKYECETMVMAFEREGTRAMKVLEGLVVE